jgi:hypothetical protein
MARAASLFPIDIKLYLPGSFGTTWIDKDFSNQKKGDEITDYMCGNSYAVYRVYAHAAGRSYVWPRQ